MMSLNSLHQAGAPGGPADRARIIEVTLDQLEDVAR